MMTNFDEVLSVQVWVPNLEVQRWFQNMMNTEFDYVKGSGMDEDYYPWNHVCFRRHSWCSRGLLAGNNNAIRGVPIVTIKAVVDYLK